MASVMAVAVQAIDRVTVKNYALEAEVADLEAKFANLRGAMYGLMDGLDANYEDRCGLSNDQWEQRIRFARSILEDQNG